jgi:hypothetical protein
VLVVGAVAVDSSVRGWVEVAGSLLALCLLGWLRFLPCSLGFVCKWVRVAAPRFPCSYCNNSSATAVAACCNGGFGIAVGAFALVARGF